MRRFRFRLEGVLQYRRQLEEQAERAFAARQRELHEVEARLEALRREMLERQQERAEWQRRPFESLRLADAARFEATLHAAIEQSMDERSRLQEALDAARAHLLRCRMDREILDRLKEKQQAEHGREALAQEQQFLDEVAVLRHGRE